VIEVLTEELPASATRLDALLHIQSPGGQDYMLVVEWQGYPDPRVLWRLAGYVAWVGQKYPRRPVVGIVVYLYPHCDIGDTLTQMIDGQMVQQWQLSCLRLWEHDASALLATGTLGLVVLSPLAKNVTDTLVEQAIDIVLTQAPRTDQADLLSILGALAESVMDKERFVRLVGKERILQSELFNYVFQGELEAFEKEKARLEAENAKLVAQLQELVEAAKVEREATIREQHVQQALVEALLTRFQTVPPALVHDIWRVKRPEQAHALIVGIVQAATLEEFEALLKQTVNHSPGQPSP
jgi:hypothetical protein